MGLSVSRAFFLLFSAVYSIRNWAEKAIRQSASLRPDLPASTFHAASVWPLLCNQEVLILTAISHRPFKDEERKMNLRLGWGGSQWRCLCCAQVERKGSAAPISDNPPLPPASWPTLKNEWKGQHVQFQCNRQLFPSTHWTSLVHRVEWVQFVVRVTVLLRLKHWLWHAEKKC